MVKHHSKKRSHKRRHRKTGRRRTMRGGFYGAAGAIAPGAMEWKAGSEYGPMVADRAGNTTAWGAPKPNGLPMYGRGRRRTKGGRSLRKRMRGGGSFGATRAEFRGSGERGQINVSQGQAKAAPGPNDYRLGSFNDGNKGFGGFAGLFPK
jgi:hypothetical protein